MFIINTTKTPQRIIFALLFFVSIILAGCAAKGEINLAKEYTNKSKGFYKKAIEEYNNLISKDKAGDQTYLEFGRLYFAGGDFQEAIKQLSKSESEEAGKLIAISFYKLGQFTQALGFFERLGFLEDNNYLYHYGLTCEKLNLYDQAIKIYGKIKNKPYGLLAKNRLNIISRFNQTKTLADLDSSIREIVQNAPGKEVFPQASAIILLAQEIMEVSSQQTAVYDLHAVIKILDERGKENFSEVIIGYDSTYERPELEYARTLKPDGEVVPVGKKHVRDVAKYLNFPLYSNARALIISMPEITEGAVIEYKLKIYKNRLINKDDFVLSYWIQENEPVLRANFKIIVPQGQDLNTRILNEEYNDFQAKLEPVILKESDKVIYEWKFKNIPQIIPEPNMARLTEIDPAILISTFDSWDAVYKWWWGLANDKIQADKNIKQQIRELIDGLETKQEKMKAIYNFCAQKIRYVAVEYGQAGYEPHQAADIFLNKYGDCKDQAVLLVTMLREAGIEAYLVLIGTKDHFNLAKDFPAPLFNHCIAVVELGEENIFLDPTAQTCSFNDLPLGDQERRVLIFKDDAYDIKTTPLYPAEHNRVVHIFDIEVNESEGIQVKKEVFSYGFYNQVQRAWLIYTQPEQIRQALEETIQEISVGSRLEGYKIENLQDLNKDVILRYNFQGPEYWTQAGNLRILPQLTSLDSSLAVKESRNYPIDFELCDTEERYFKIILPAAYSIKYLPEDINLDNLWMEFSSNYTSEGNTVYFKQKRVLKKKDIDRQEYSEFKKFYQDLARRIKQRIVLEEEE
jgi:hypothetical protein